MMARHKRKTLLPPLSLPRKRVRQQPAVRRLWMCINWILPAAAISAVGLFWLHGFIKRRRTPADEAGNDLDIGQTVKILRRVSEGQYEVSYRGTTWQARALNARAAAEPSFAVIGGKEGNILLVHLN